MNVPLAISEHPVPEHAVSAGAGKMNIFYVDPFQLDRNGQPATWKLWFAKSMIVFAVLSRIFLLLQTIQLYDTKNSGGLSLASYILYIVSMLLWMFYAYYVLKLVNWPLMVSSVLGLALAIVILVGIVVYT